MTKRRGRRVAIVVLVLVLLLVLADRLAARLASTAAVGAIVQHSQGLTSRPTVKFGGFPFLTQVALGKYSDISVGITGMTATGSPRIAHISGHLEGAHIPLSKVIGGDEPKVPVDHISAAIVLRYADLNAFLKNEPGHLVLAQRNGALQISARLEAGGTTFQLTGSARLGVDGSGFTVTPISLHLANGGLLGDITDALGGVLSHFAAVPVPLPELPFDLRLTSVHTDNNGIQASAAADNVLLDPTQK